MIYAIPLSDGSFGFAQGAAACLTNVIDVAVFSRRAMAEPMEAPALEKDELVSLSATWRQSLNRGDWKALAKQELVCAPLEFPNQQLLAQGTTIGIKHCDSGIIQGLLEAWHGLAPWNVMFKEDYFDQMLAPHVSRPATAVILSADARLRFRTTRGHEK